MFNPFKKKEGGTPKPPRGLDELGKEVKTRLQNDPSLNPEEVSEKVLLEELARDFYPFDNVIGKDGTFAVPEVFLNRRCLTLNTMWETPIFVEFALELLNNEKTKHLFSLKDYLTQHSYMDESSQPLLNALKKLKREKDLEGLNNFKPKECKESLDELEELKVDFRRYCKEIMKGKPLTKSQEITIEKLNGLIEKGRYYKSLKKEEEIDI